MRESCAFTRSAWLPLVQPSFVGGINLFCFPYSGASAAVYQPWMNSSPNGITCVPVELPGHGRRLAEPLSRVLYHLVEGTAAGLLPYLQAPFAFFGHSMGALLSFELARLLHDRYGIHPVHLFVSSSAAPHLACTEAPISDLPEGQFVQVLREMNGMDEAILACTELRDLLLPILRADFSICENYRYTPGERFDFPITAMGGLGDVYVPRSNLEAWGEHTQGRFRLRLFPGDHFYLHGSRRLLIETIASSMLGG